MAEEKPLSTLYKSLKESGYDVPDNYDQFERALTAHGKAGSDNRHSLYTSLFNDGYDVPTSYSSFYSSLFEPVNVTTSRARGGSNPAQSAPAQNVQKTEPAQAKKPNGTPMTERERLRMSLGASDMAYNSARNVRSTNERIQRMTESATAQGAARERNAKNVARTLGSRTDLTGLYRGIGGGIDASAGENNTEDIVQSSPKPYGVVYENGEAVTQWLMPDGSITTSHMEAEAGEAAARQSRLTHAFNERMRENGLDKNNPDDVQKQAMMDYEAPLAKAVSEIWKKAEAKQAANERADYEQDVKEAKKTGGVMDAIRAMVAASQRDVAGRNSGEYLRDLDRAVRKNRTFDIEKMAQEVYDNYGKEHGYSKDDVYRAMFQQATAANMPKGTTDFLLRKIGDQPLISPYQATELAARGLTGNYNLSAADATAMDEYGQKHRVADVTGTVLNMAFDPITYMSAGFGSLVSKQALGLAGKFMLKGAAKDVAERYAARTLTGRLIGATAGGAANFSFFETAKGAQQQIQMGGVVNDETGEREFSASELLKATGRGALLGGATGVLSPIIGNVADKVVKMTSSTAGKMGVRAGELVMSTLAEGTVFSMPEWIEGKRSPMDVWSDNMAMMLGFKANHLMKSAPRVIADLSPVKHPRTIEERNQNRKNFVERLRNRIDRSNSDMDFSREELQELAKGGYADLAKLFVPTNKNESKAKPKMTDGKMVLFDGVEEGELIGNKEFDGYEAMEKLMQDKSVSQSTRAKAYYILTGHTLPMGTITGYTTETDERGNIFVKAMTANGEVVTNKRFADEASAKREQDNIMRQAELNSVDVGERYREAASNIKVVQAAVEQVAPGADFETVMRNYKAVKDGDADAVRNYGDMVKEIDKAIESNKGVADAERPEAIRASIKEETGVDVDKAIKKGPGKRTEQEQAAVEDYVKHLFQEEKGAETGTERPEGEAEAADIYNRARLTWEDAAKGDPKAKADMDNIAERMQEAYRQCEDAFGTDAEWRMAEMADDPWEMVNNPELTEYQQDAVLEYIKAKAAMDGVQDASNDALESKRSEVAASVERHTNRDNGMVQPAVMKEDDNKRVYIVKGNVVAYPDGSGVDIVNSDQTIVICDAETGEYKFASPDQILNVEEAIDPQAELDEAYANIQAEHEAVLGGTGNGEEQGAEPTAVAGEEAPQAEAEAQQPQMTEEQMQQRKAEEANRKPTALSQIPVDGKTGEPMYEQADPATAWDAIVEQTGGDEGMAKTVVESMVADKEAALKKAEKAKSKQGSTIAEKIAAEQERQAAIDNAKAELEHWKKIAMTQQRKNEAERIKKEEKRKAAEARAEEREGETESNSGRSENSQGNRGLQEQRDEGVQEVHVGLGEKEADGLLSQMEANAAEMPQLELNPSNWVSQFGEEGTVSTPIGQVKMGVNQIAKLFEKGRSEQFGMIKPTLENPQVIIEVPSESNDGNTERSSSLLFVKTFVGKDGKKIYYYKSVTVKKDGLEVSVSSHYDRVKRVKEALKNGKLLYRFDGGAQTEHHPADVSVTTSHENGQGFSSADKVTNNHRELQTNNEKNTGREEDSLSSKVASASEEVNTNPTEAQKEAGNYKKGHVQVGTFDITIEQPEGSIRRGTDANGKQWESKMHNTYGYFRGTEGVDGDHIDVFLSNDIDGWNGRKVYVVDQYNPDGTFDEHKVMLGFNDMDEAKSDYLANYEKGWEDGRRITVSATNIEDFEKWIASSHRKTKPFSEYSSVKKEAEGEDLFQKAERIAKEEEKKREEKKGNVLPIGTGVFGDIYDKFKGKAKEAFEFLVSHGKGDLLGVFHRDGVGDIDVVWGDKGGGLDHIISKHVGEGKSFANIDEAAHTIKVIINKGKIDFENGDKIVFRKGSEIVTIRKNVRAKGKKIADKNWVLTAYDEMSADGGVSAIAPTNKGQAARTTDKSAHKGTNKKQKTQGKDGDSVRKAEEAYRVALDHESDVEQEWEEKIQDYVFEHYPTQAVRSAESTSERGLREREAMRNDPVLKKMREKADAEYDKAREVSVAAFEKLEKVKDGGKPRLQKAVADNVEATAKKHGVDAMWLARYAEGMKEKNSAAAWGALRDIKALYLREHTAEKKALMEREGVNGLIANRRLFEPIEKAIKEKFGDVDVLIEERRKQAEIERGVMEAARKRAEEEARKREARLEELVQLTDEEIDKRYAEALDKGDEATAREMLDEAARRKGYGDAESDYQGVGAWSAPSDPGYATAEERRADIEENGGDVNVEDIAADYSPVQEEMYSHPERTGFGDEAGIEAGRAINNALNALKAGKKDVKIKVYRAVPTSVKEGKLRNGDWVTPSRKYAENHGNSRLEGKYRIMEDEVPANELWFDGNDIREWGYDNGKSYRYKNAKNNRKLNDLITRDDKGNVIPPSKRFNSRKADERYQKADEAKQADKRERVLRDAVVDRLREAGLDVSMDTDKGQRVLDEVNGKAKLSAKKRRALETVSVPRDEKHQPTVVSSADGAKVLNELDTTKEKYENQSNRTNTFLGDVAKALGAERHGSASEYATFETKNGRIVTIRLANHNAKVSNFDNRDESEGISIVVSPKKSEGMTNDGAAHVVEYYYDALKLRRADGKPLADIVRSIKQVLYSGEFTDTTGLAERQEVNADDVARYHKVYHGSGADFDHFDHSHMGEGEGAQAYGWGTYVTEVEGIGRTYAHSSAMGDSAHEEMEYTGDALTGSEVNVVKYAFDGGRRTYHEVETFLEGIANSNKPGAQRSARALALLRKTQPTDWRHPLQDRRHLYTVEIPDDTGENYLDWDNALTDGQIGRIREYLGANYRKNKVDDFDASMAEVQDAPNAAEVNAWTRRGENVYKTLTSLLGTDKEVSKALSEMGFVGIKYPADYLRGGREDGKQNYVIFNEADAKITDHVRFFRTENGEAYGFTVGGKIYIDPRVANAETPIHEYAHLWATALRHGAPKEWKNVVELMKDTKVWDEVKKRYPELETEDEVADEVLAQYSGRRGAERLREEMRKITEGKDGVFEKAKAVSALERVKAALDKFWKAVADFLHIHYKSAEEVADRVMKDLLDGVDPRKFGGESEKVREQFIGERGAERADRTEEVNTRLENLRVAREMEAERKDAKAVKMATGWERGADGKWRYEIADVKYHPNGDAEYIKLRSKQPWNTELDALENRLLDGEQLTDGEMVRFDELAEQANKFKADFLSREKNRLADWVEDKELFDAYPELKNVEMVFTDQLPENEGGYYSAEENRIVVNTVSYMDTESVIAHELQHAIQRIEGFARGGSAERVEQDFQKAKAEKAARVYAHELEETAKELGEGYNQVEVEKALIKEYEDMDMQEWIPDNETRIKGFNYFARGYADRSMDDAIKRFRLDESVRGDFSPYLEYRKLGGEVEARNVQNRMRMTPEERRQSLAAETEDVAREDQIFLNGSDGDTEAANMLHEKDVDGTLKKVNDKFNEQIGSFTAENADRTIFDLGYPSDKLLAGGVSKKPIRLYGSKVAKKMKKHGFAIEELRDLPKAVANPIAVFANQERDGNRSILTELKTANGNFLVTIDLGKGSDADFDVVSSVFGKKGNGIISWINKGYMKYADKEKALSYLHLSAPIAEASEKSRLLSAAKVVKDFESNKPLSKNVAAMDEDIKDLQPNYTPIEGDINKDNYEKSILKMGLNTVHSWLWKNSASYLPYREIFSKPTLDDYFINTQATFNEIPLGRMTIDEKWESLKSQNGMEWHKSPKSNSEYVIDRKNGDIYRKSDHWGRVATCQWDINTKPQYTLLDTYSVNAIAKANISDFVPWMKRIDKFDFAPRNNEDAKPYIESIKQSIVNYKDALQKMDISEYVRKRMEEAVQNFYRLLELQDSKGYIPNTTKDVLLRRSEDNTSAQTSNNEAKRDAVNRLSEELHIGNVIVHETAEGMTGRKAKAKGWFDTNMGEVHIVLSNNKDKSDVENTFMHEVVGHDGLRVLFPEEEKLNNALDELYRVSNDSIKHTIDRMAQKMYDAEVDRLREQKRKAHEAKGEDVGAAYYADMAEAHAEASKKREQFRRDATEEYGADLAGRIGESGFEKMSADELSFWGRLKAMLQKALEKLLNGLKIPGKRKWGDKEWSFVLHEAYKRKKNGGRPTVFDVADTEVMRRKTGFGETKFSDGYKKSARTSEAALKHLEPSDAEHDAKVVQKRENAKEALDKVAKTYENVSDSKGFISELSTSLGLTRGKTGSGYGSFTSANGRTFTIRVSNHNINTSHIESEPVESIVIKTKRSPNRFQATDGKFANEYVYFKEDIKKAPAGTLSSIAESISELLDTGEFRDKTGLAKENHSPEEPTYNGLMFRDGDDVEYEKALARDIYERRVSRGLYQMQEAMQDSMLGLKEAMEAVMKAEGKKLHIEDIDGYENAYLGENRLSSVNKAECDEFTHSLFEPMLKEASKFAKTADERAELTDYMMAKHGLERNRVMAHKDAERKAKKEVEGTIKKLERVLNRKSTDAARKAKLARKIDEMKALAIGIQNGLPAKEAQDWYDKRRNAIDKRYANGLYTAEQYKSAVNKLSILYTKGLAYWYEQGFRERDYAGLTALTGKDDVNDAEQYATQMVNDYESAHDTAELWGKVNAVTGYTLKKSYSCGIIDRETYNAIDSMYQHYIPLRGFADKTGEDAYAYIGSKRSMFNAPIKTTKGRKSKADDPFANMNMMAESAIMQGNRNVLVKQKFLNFALKHPSDLISVSDLWLRYDDAADEWKPVNTGDIAGTDALNVDDSPAEIEQKMATFEAEMEKLRQMEPDKYCRQKEQPNIPYRVVEKSDLREHQVLVKRNGKDYLLTINGNPRAAQALNGETNPDNDNNGAVGAIFKLGETVNRWLSSVYTTKNPDFVLSNFLRDVQYANTIVWVKEGPNYALKFHRNFIRVNPVKMKLLFEKLRKGTLNMADPMDKQFREFIMNGGETGYTNVRDIENHKSEIAHALKKYNGRISLAMAWDLLEERMDEYNRAVENCARFAAYITSREMMRSIERSIYDAKEISVNFNKKGSGAKFLNAEGQTTAGKSAAFLSGSGRAFYTFWNAAVQGTTNFGKQIVRNPKKGLALVASMFTWGMINAMMNAEDDSDDEKNSYYNIPEYTRRSNVLFRAPGMTNLWISMPLTTEYRGIYGLGELAGSAIAGKVHLSDGEMASQIAGQVSQMFPIDMLEGGGGLNVFAPSWAKPIVEVRENKSWTGMPIYKDTEYNKNYPEWTKAYKNANKYLVEAAKTLNEKTGGDAYTPGLININPAQVEYMLNGYFGGISSTIDKLTKSGETIVGKREFDPRSFLFLNRVVKSGDERTEMRAINNEYSRIKEEYEKLKTRKKHYEEDTDNGIFNYADKISYLNSSKEHRRMLVFEDYYEDIKDIMEEMEDATSEDERKDLEKELYQKKKELVEAVNNVQ